MQLLLNKWVARPVAAILATAMVVTQAADAWADSISQGAQQGREAASAYRPNIEDLFSTAPDGSVTLFPNASTPLPLDMGEIFPGSAGQDADALQSLYGDDPGMTTAGNQAHTRLQSEESMEGEAYRTLVGSTRVSRPDLGSDPIWDLTDTTWDNLGDEFGECTTTNTYTPGSFQAHVPDYKTCERVADETRNCTVRHTIKAGVVDHLEGPLNITSCGTGCTEIWIGTVGDNYWTGQCKIYSEAIKVDVFNPEAVVKAELVYAKWDDYMQVLINGTKVWSGPNGLFPPETEGACELSTSWESNPGVDVTSHFQRRGELEFRTRVSVYGEGEGYAKVRIHYDPTKIVEEEEWSPEDCERSLIGLGDRFCTGSYTCTDMPPTDENGCAVIDGVLLCPDMLGPSPHPGLSPLCRQATVNASCDFYAGDMECWTDPQGNLQCPTNEGGNLDSCAEYEESPNCGFIRSECVSGAEGASGQCYVREEVWDCGYDRTIPTVIRTPTTSCPGPIRCMGTECVNPTTEQSGDFARAAAALQAARFMAMDADCGEDTTEENRNCEVFKGEGRECKSAVGGIVDCCDQPAGVSLGSYISMILAVGKLDSAVGALDQSNALRGAWETLTGPVESAWTEVNKPFVQAWENIWGGTEATASDAASKTVMSAVQQELINKVGEWTAQLFGDAAANSLFSVAGSNGTAFVGGAAQGPLQLGGGQAIVGTALGWIMAAYTIYTITMILIQMIWQCEEDEFELAAQRELKNCHYVGSYCATEVLGACIEKRESYCCFNSPLSRIIQEQVRPQLAMSWGAAENPQCGGIMADQLQAVDWSRVNLDEWLGILAETGHLPTDSSINIEALTGNGSALAIGSRDDAVTRAIERMENIDVDAARQQATEELKNTALP